MDAELWRRVERVLDGALDLPPAERRDYVARACGGEPGLAAEVERLLRADELAGDFLEAPVEARADRLMAALRGTGKTGEPEERVGPYRLVRELGRGGMGTVYLAERADGQFEQQVALKVIGRAVVTPALLRRFAAERQILARLRHPGIAHLLDGGLSDGGLTYFALEHVEGGVPVTDYCRDHTLGLEARLDLFEQICRAAQYAHHNLVVHRDLKPSNVLVTPGGEVKLVDFGIAKLLGDEGDDGDATRTLGDEPRPMTPRYAAPEVILGRPITTAADVYSLGVLLYELLAGEVPWAPRGGSLPELQRAVLEREPEPPSRTLLARDPRLARRLRGDLDAITLTALAREPERRYPSVEALLDDLNRHRQGRPIAARAAGPLDRGLRFARRHRLAVTAAALVALSLGLGMAGTLWQARAALAEARRAEEVKRFLIDLFEVADPDATGGETLTARELLERGANRLDSELAQQPAMRAEMFQVVGELHRRLGDYETARNLLERCLEIRRAAGPRHPEVGEALLSLADVHHTMGDFELAETRYLEALPLLKEGHRLRLRAESYLARLRFDQGRYDLAEPVLRDVLECQRRALGHDDPDTLDSLNALARLLDARGDPAAAGALFLEVAELRRRRFGDFHSSVTEALGNAAMIHHRLGEAAEAEALYRQIVDIDRRLRPGHPHLAMDLNNLANVLSGTGRLVEAEALAREALGIAETAYGRDRAPTAIFLATLGRTLQRRGLLDEAESLSRRALAVAEASFPAGHEHVAFARMSLAHVLAERGLADEAESLFRQALEVLRQRLPPHDRRTAGGLLGLGRLLRASGRAAEAEPLLSQAHGALAAGRPDPRAAEAARELAACLEALGRADEAAGLRLPAGAEIP